MLRDKFRNVLVFNIGSPGDTVVKLPCFHLERTVFPKARITLLANQPIGAKVVSAFSVLDGAGLVDDYMVYSPTRRPVQLAAIWKEAVQRRFDCLVSLRRHVTPRPAIAVPPGWSGRSTSWRATPRSSLG